MPRARGVIGLLWWSIFVIWQYHWWSMFTLNPTYYLNLIPYLLLVECVCQLLISLVEYVCQLNNATGGVCSKVNVDFSGS